MIINYDSNNYAILIDKKKLDNVGFREGDNFYVINLDRGVIALVKKSDFKNVLKQKIRDSLGSDYNTMRDFGLSNEQIKVIDKIIGVRFEERTKSNISTSLNDEENNILNDLIKSNTIKIYDQGKYSDNPVYSVTPDLFKYVKTSLNTNTTNLTTINNKPKQQFQYTKPQTPPQPQIKSNVDLNVLIDKMNKEGFIVAENDNEAKMLSESLSQKIKAGQILGIKGFDSKYYIFTSDFFNKSTDKISNCFSKNNGKCSLKDMSEITGLNDNVCKGILMFLLEKGDIIEKSNSTYQML
jgi:hypothetical protein